MKRYRWIPLLLGLAMATGVRADQVIADDHIVQGSLCIGLDCINNESFGFDTIRFKENNLRIKFEDTGAAGEPVNIWQITINDSASGGAEHFSIEDITASSVPFKILAGARDNSLHLASGGEVGLGTASPVLKMQIQSSDTPALRFEQDASEGATPQTWDTAGNEANFFIRDVSGGSRLPFRIRPGAAHNSLTIAANGGIGAGTPIPAAQLHVFRDNGTAQVKVEESHATVTARTLLDVVNNGTVVTRFEAAGNTWLQTVAADSYRLAPGLGATPALRLSGTGNVALAGTLAQGSSRDLKQDIAPLDLANTFDKALQLPLFDWRYVADAAVSDRHIGPMAEDFHGLFGTGADPRALAPGDVAAVALAAVQRLNRQLEEKEGRLAALLDRLTELERRFDRSREARP